MDLYVRSKQITKSPKLQERIIKTDKSVELLLALVGSR